jgi:putative hemolysin
MKTLLFRLSLGLILLTALLPGAPFSSVQVQPALGQDILDETVPTPIPLLPTEPLPANDRARADTGAPPSDSVPDSAIEEIHEIELSGHALQEDTSVQTPEGVRGWMTIMSEDFEGTFPSGAWTVFDNNGSSYGELYWDDDDYLPHSGGWSAWAANGGADGLDPQYYYYTNNMDSWMVYGPFDLGDADDAELLFYYWNQSEQDYDWFGWYASINGSNFYGYHTSGDSGGWIYRNFDLTNVPTLGDVTGDSSVWIAFTFQSDGSNVNDGPFVDDITLQKNTPSGEPNLTPYTPSGWDYPIVPSSVPGTHTVNDLCADLTTYIDWAVANTGSADIPQTFYTCLEFDGMQLQCWYTSGLSQGYYAYVEDWILNVTPTQGWHNLEICTDVYNDVDESNEYDNCWDHDFYWDICAGEPDLEATDIDWFPSDPDAYDNIELIGTVTNIGDADSGSFENTIYLQGVPQCTWPVSNLSPGQQSQHTCSVGTLASGDYFVSVEADSNDDVDESNEGNNNRNEVMTVGGEPDIEVTPESLTHTCPQQAAAASELGKSRANTPLFSDYLFMKNPAAVYCTHLGYDFQIVESPNGGQYGICKLPDETTCDAWDFLNGKCGQDHSVCALEGLETVTLRDGKNPFSQEYAVCADSEGNLLESVTDIIDLVGKSKGGAIDNPLGEFLGPPEPPLDSEPREGDVPASFDWRTYNGSDWTTPVRDQGICGSCWAFSAVGVTEGVINIASNDPDLDLGGVQR